MRVFNAFQITAAFVAWPFLISWLTTAEFRGAQVAFFAACALYVVAFAAMVGCVYETACRREW
jgi:hypothetical protein